MTPWVTYLIIGVNISLQDEQAVGPKNKRDKKCAEVYDPWLAAASQRLQPLRLGTRYQRE